MPKARPRRSPPKLPDHLVERLRAEVSVAREKAAEQPNGKVAEQAEVAPHQPKNAIRVQRPKNVDGPRFPQNVVAPEPPKNVDAPHAPKSVVAARPQPQQVAWRVVPDSPYSAVADPEDTTEPIPVVQPAGPSAALAPSRGFTAADVVDRQSDRVTQQKVAAQLKKVDRPDCNRQPDNGRQRVNRDQAEDADQPDDAPTSGRTNSAGVARSRTRRGLAVVPMRARKRPRDWWRVGLMADSRPSADLQPTMLQALFAETDSLEEVVASARAQAGRLQGGLEWRYRMVALIVIAMVILGVLVFLGSR